MSTAFDDVRLPEDIESGALVGPRFSTDVVNMAGGKEQRNAAWEQERLYANIAYGIMQKESAEDIEDSFARVLRFFRARMGRHRSFRFRDVSDFEAVNAWCQGNTERTKFQLMTHYGDYHRRITRPVVGTLTVYVAGAIAPANSYTLDPLGIVRFNEPKLVDVTADFEFDVPMRFDSDVMQVSIEYQNAGSIPNIDLIQTVE